MRIEIHLLSQSQPMEYKDVKNAYMKEGMYCILLDDNSVTKFPMVNIFRVKEFEDDFHTLEYDLDDLTLEGDISATHKNFLLLPKELAKEVFEINKLDISEDDDINTLITDDVVFYFM